MGDRASVSVAIASWNSADCIGPCLEALFAQSLPPSDVVVVDNGSSDDTVQIVEARFPQVRLVRRPSNEGFCLGYNRAIRATESPYVLILNTDVFLDRDFLLRASEAIARDDAIGWIAANVTRADGNGVDYVGCFLRRRLALVNSENVSRAEDVFAGSGSVIFCRRAMLSDIAHDGEIYDESFFAYVEDLDLAWRAQLRGWRCVFEPEARAIHVGSASLGGRIRVVEKPAFFQRHILKNRYLAVVKNATPGVFVTLLPWLVLAQMGIVGSFLLRQPRRIGLVADGYREAWRLLPDALRKRRRIQARRVTTDRHVRSMMRGF